jgi:hypothetical protein
MLFLSTADIEFCNIMEFSTDCPTYQTDEQYTVKINSSDTA